MYITLTVTAGPHRGQVFKFTDRDTFLVGRSKYAHFRLRDKDKYFSRIHFLMEIDPPNCKLVDLRSRNGTFVNGQRVTVLELKNGDRIQAGHTVLQLGVHPEEVSAN